MASRKKKSGSTADDGFAARGGWWVMAQIPLLIAAFGVPVLWPAAVQGTLPSLLSLLGFLMLGAGAAIVLAGFVTLGEMLTPFPMPRARGRLRQRGIYAWVRHPVYAGLLLAVLGFALWRWSAPGLVMWAVLVVFFDRKAAHEEQLLIRRFPAYRAYLRRVRRFVPGVY
jgi:protein-S-isoprenylcysteine O-methyltransferase Ste14